MMAVAHKRKPFLRFKNDNGEEYPDWEEKKLGDIGKVRMCKRIFSYQTSPDGDIPFYKIGTFGKNADSYISNDLYQDFKEKYPYPQVGDILLSASGTIGRKVVFDGKPSYFQDSNIVWLENNENLISNKFLYFLYDVVKYESEGGTIQRLYNSIISKTRFLNPSLPEQKKIADFLSSVDQKVQLLEKKKEQLELYKKGLMQQLFTQQIRFKDDNGEEYPDWEEKKLGEVAYILMGQSPNSTSYNYDGIGILLIQGNADITNRKSKPRQWTTEPTKICHIGDLIMTVRAPVGYISKSIHKACIGRGVCSISCQKNNSLDFIYQFLLSYESKWKRLEQGSTFSAVNSNDIKSLLIQCPSLPEQKKIADFLSSVDKKIEITSTQIDKTKAFKKGLLQQMFV